MNEENRMVDEGKCAKCGGPLTGDCPDGICMQCQVADVEERIPEPEPKKEGGRTSFAAFWKYARWGVIVVCLAVCWFYLMAARDLMADRKPIRNGTYDTDAATDQCIQNLWKAAALLQGGKKIPDSLVCPACGKPYVVSKDGDVVTVSCPEPSKHHCSAIKIDSKHLVPEVIK